jgi:hypothetical protein
MSEVRVVPANEATWEDLEAVIGGRGYHAGCWCQRFKMQADDSVWAATCFVTRKEFRRAASRMRSHAPPSTSRGSAPAPSRATGRSIFAAAGLEEVSRPSLRRVVMRLDFA